MEKKLYESSSLPDLSVIRSLEDSFKAFGLDAYPSFDSDYGSASSSCFGSEGSYPSTPLFKSSISEESTSKNSGLSKSWLSDETLYNVIRVIYPHLYSDKIVRLDVVNDSDSSVDTLRGSLSSHISSNQSLPFISLIQVKGNHWVTVFVKEESPSRYHAFYANSIASTDQDDIIFSALRDSGVAQIHKLSVSLQENGNNCGIYAISHANEMVRAFKSDRMPDLIRDGIHLSAEKINQLGSRWSDLLAFNQTNYFRVPEEGHYINHPISLSSTPPLFRPNVDALCAAMASFTSRSSSNYQYSHSGTWSRVDDFIDHVCSKLKGDNLTNFKEKFIPIFKEKLIKAESDLQKSIISCFMQGVSFSYPILSTRPLDVWVKESLVADLKNSYAADSNKLLYPYLVSRLDELVSGYKDKDKRGSIEALLYAIRNKTKGASSKESLMALIDLLDLLKFLSPIADYTHVPTLISHYKEWSTWLPGRYIDHLLSSSQVSLDKI
ncbi:hypothetical protein ACRRVD_03010 [Candidatus Cardinium hertigii]|uniref:hypothetical protein n=1 Tax=Candidatus Cardinium hertigii TaxID=247481 RepID=UPI003D7D176B